MSLNNSADTLLKRGATSVQYDEMGGNDASAPNTARVDAAQFSGDGNNIQEPPLIFDKKYENQKIKDGTYEGDGETSFEVQNEEIVAVTILGQRIGKGDTVTLEVFSPNPNITYNIKEVPITEFNVAQPPNVRTFHTVRGMINNPDIKPAIELWVGASGGFYVPAYAIKNIGEVKQGAPTPEK